MINTICTLIAKSIRNYMRQYSYDSIIINGSSLTLLCFYYHIAKIIYTDICLALTTTINQLFHSSEYITIYSFIYLWKFIFELLLYHSSRCLYGYIPVQTTYTDRDERHSPDNSPLDRMVVSLFLRTTAAPGRRAHPETSFLR